MSEPRTEARVEPVDTLYGAIDVVMPVLKDIDPDWQSRWTTASLLIEELHQRGFVLIEREAAAPDASAAPGLPESPVGRLAKPWSHDEAEAYNMGYRHGRAHEAIEAAAPPEPLDVERLNTILQAIVQHATDSGMSFDDLRTLARLIEQVEVVASGVWTVIRHGGRNADEWRELTRTNNEQMARDKYRAERDRMRQGGVRLIGPLGSVIDQAWAPRLRTRW